ncbi:unnamed protein product [Didymodactylos carnosus]|uniref:Uncharacterized protein n=1 Tax=Didymodactylos carnosus TaxID=1234261 RepID=A0A813V946_9BILA|nr:unnamed protein product [Didymodactylos carnosus]CAF1262640.1 unnamed protein product [Didymodactylos carnosus]CAF3627348.1 unnamed protein product [Didymodactylos carnosus]CAF4069100.1 unnamed protein product [Didymodactylos carnosus]
MISDRRILHDYSYGGATTDENLVQGYTKAGTVAVPGVKQQIQIYLKTLTKMRNNDFNSNETIYIISAGGNNYFFNRTLSPLIVGLSIISCIKALVSHGGKYIIIANQPPSQYYPYYAVSSIRSQNLSLVSTEHNRVLKLLIEQYQKNNRQISIILFDVHEIVSKIIVNKEKYTFTSLDKCWDSITNSTTTLILCNDTSKHIFIDEYHFTTKMHSLIAQGIFDQVHMLFNSSPTKYCLNSLTHIEIVLLVLCLIKYYH